jgi:hypothetical protein
VATRELAGDRADSTAAARLGAFAAPPAQRAPSGDHGRFVDDPSTA